jgi:hypothetical protein
VAMVLVSSHQRAGNVVASTRRATSAPRVILQNISPPDMMRQIRSTVQLTPREIPNNLSLPLTDRVCEEVPRTRSRRYDERRSDDSRRAKRPSSDDDPPKAHNRYQKASPVVKTPQQVHPPPGHDTFPKREKVKQR